MSFCFIPAYFRTDADKILYAMKLLKGDPRDIWFRHEKIISLEETTWEYFKKFFLDIIKDPVNRELNAA